MAAAASLLVAGGTGAATHFSGEFQQLGRFGVRLRKQSVNGSKLARGNWCQIRSRRNNLKLKPSFAIKNNSNVENTDEMFDDLLNKYGKVVFKRNDQKPLTAEVDDDAESLSFAVALAKVASDVKAADLKVLFVKPLVYWTQYFIIATAFSRPQIDAIASRVRDLAEKQYGKVPSGDTKPNSWTLLDFGDVVVHIFLPPQRTFYNLEDFYGNATAIELPFENQPPPQLR
ncbi:protein Iojap, chloroplastic [Mercurialis annua]|uniref:protein Iojap, chloroplastic n=1 Tax=Mercurialis annua TaxID=3986 RepID=UPI0021608229|nr:protein Iojap, chloroplastic [Mercurialis annua]